MLPETEIGARRVADLIAEGMSTKDALKEAGISAQSYARARASVRDLAMLHSCAVETRSDLYADEVISIADTDPDANRARNRIQARQWLVSKQNPRNYGDQMTLTFQGSVSINDALSEARARVLPMRDQQQVYDAQIFEDTIACNEGASDSVSDFKAPSGEEPDIFS